MFKPKKDNSGAASQWEFNPKKGAIFVEFANQEKTQDGQKSFDWANKITMKLGVADIGEILATIAGKQDGIGQLDRDGKHKGLFHQTDKGNTILQLAKGGKANMFYLRISSQPKGQQVVAITHSMTVGESMILETLLKSAIPTIHRWHLTD